MRKFSKTIASTLAIGLGATLAFAPSAQAQEVSGLKEWAVNTKASSMEGKERYKNILDLKVFNGELYSGYGDYSDDIGPIDVVSHNLATGKETNHLSVPTEELNTYRIINEKLYTPYVDPKGPWESPVGYASNKSGAWANYNETDFIHVFDVASTGDDLWLVGSALNPDKAKYGPSNNVAMVKRSIDGGATWTVEKVTSTGSATEYERNYWIVAVGDKIYTNAETYMSEYRMDVWENGEWSEDLFWLPISMRKGSDVETLGENIIAKTFNDVLTYNTKTKTPMYAPFGGVTDLYKSEDGKRVYALTNGKSSGAPVGTIAPAQEIISTTDGINWVKEMTISAGAVPNYKDSSGEYLSDIKSIAVENGVFYFGASNGKIYRDISHEDKPRIYVDYNVNSELTLNDLSKNKLRGVTAVSASGENLTNTISVKTKSNLHGTAVHYTVKDGNKTETLIRNVNLN